MLIKINIKEHNSPYPESYEAEAIINIDTNRLKNDKEICNACQQAYDEYFSTLDYANKEEASDDGICFGSCFPFIPANITNKYGFQIVKLIEYTADYDNGFE